jgi:diaminopimelate decarboxylase
MINTFIQFLKNNLSLTDKLPLYLYNRKEIDKRCIEFIGISYPNKAIHYAIMANSNPEILKIIKENGFNIFVNSLTHLKLAQQIGYNNEQIIYTASALSTDMMSKIKKAKTFINLDSLKQVELWSQQFKDEKFGIRCNLHVDNNFKTKGGYFLGEKSRLGITPKELLLIKNKNMVNMLHLYVGTDILNINYFFECYNKLLEIANLFPELEYIDFGGGFGISTAENNSIDFKDYDNQLTKLMKDFSAKRKRDICLILEPGRIIIGESAIFICKVTDIKKRDNRQFIGVNASSVQFPRPLFYQDEAFHPVRIIDSKLEEKEGNESLSVVYGCSTYSRDFLALNMLLPEANIGDYVVIENAGAYCASAYTRFLGFEPAQEIVF